MFRFSNEYVHSVCGQQWYCQINTLLVCSAMADNKCRGLGDSKFTVRGQSTPTAVAQEPAYATAVGWPLACSGSKQIYQIKVLTHFVSLCALLYDLIKTVFNKAR